MPHHVVMPPFPYIYGACDCIFRYICRFVRTIKLYTQLCTFKDNSTVYIAVHSVIYIQGPFIGVLRFIQITTIQPSTHMCKYDVCLDYVRARIFELLIKSCTVDCLIHTYMSEIIFRFGGVLSVD